VTGSSDATPWLPRLCALCGLPVRVSKDSFGCSYRGAGTIANPAPKVWHLDRCPVPAEAA
jgi:hypothetical protein